VLVLSVLLALYSHSSIGEMVDNRLLNVLLEHRGREVVQGETGCWQISRSCFFFPKEADQDVPTTAILCDDLRRPLDISSAPKNNQGCKPATLLKIMVFSQCLFETHYGRRMAFPRSAPIPWIGACGRLISSSEGNFGVAGFVSNLRVITRTGGDGLTTCGMPCQGHGAVWSIGIGRGLKSGAMNGTGAAPAGGRHSGHGRRYLL
jgi:hypothetical protein